MNSAHSCGWDHCLKQIRNSNVIDDKNREQLIETVAILRKNLGDEWPSKLESIDHPISWCMQNIQCGDFSGVLSALASNLSVLENVADLEKIVSRVGQKNEFHGAMAELEVGGRLAGNGCRLKIGPECGDKRPDFLCNADGLEFLVEVKAMGTAEESKKANRTSQRIIDACRPIFPYGHIFKPLSEPHLAEIESMLREKARLVRDDTVEEVDIPNVLRICLVHDEASDRVKKINEWCHRQELDIIRYGGGLSGPPDGIAEHHRIKTAIRAVAREKQIPDDRIGVLAITSNFSSWSMDAEKLVDEVIEEVYGCDNIPAVVISTRTRVISSGKSGSIDRENYVIATHYRDNSTVERALVIKNRFCKYQFDYDALGRAWWLGLPGLQT